MKNVWITLCVVSILLCSGPAAAAETLQPITIQLNWVTNVEFAGILLAKDRGWYAEVGIDLTIKGWEAGISSIDEMIAGKAQIGVDEGSAIIEARAQGHNIKAIAVQFQKSPFCLISKNATGIKTPEDLAGKRIGIKMGASTLMTDIVLLHGGLKHEDITPVKIGWELQPLLDDVIDVLPGYMNDEPLDLKAQGHDVTYIPAFKHGYDFYSCVYIVSETLIAEQPELIRSFLNVTLRGWKAAFQDPAATAALIVEKYYPDGSVDQQTQSLKIFHTLATIGVGDALIGFMEERFWEKGIDILHTYQQIEQKIPARDVFTMEFLPKASQQ